MGNKRQPDNPIMAWIKSLLARYLEWKETRERAEKIQSRRIDADYRYKQKDYIKTANEMKKQQRKQQGLRNQEEDK